jgi:hypothetical protein
LFIHRLGLVYLSDPKTRNIIPPISYGDSSNLTPKINNKSLWLVPCK